MLMLSKIVTLSYTTLLYTYVTIQESMLGGASRHLDGLQNAASKDA
jgi:hypothetical protein